ncbi:multicopper oxidase domain-containing protein [Salinimicrobium gaetbulicola]|uniref:Multicopper oxidase domain-containing protein n=1 Tax=Salinimicrobium gaetbulicola TaxID=999702 RepID=A0ABW3IDF8_9FLAO
MKQSLLKGGILLLIFNFVLAFSLPAQHSQNGEMDFDELDPVTHPKFVNELPFPEVLQPITEGGNYYKVYIKPVTQDLGLVDPFGNPLNETMVWGYGHNENSISYPGPTIEAYKNHTIQVEWVNDLPKEHLFAIDKSIHWAATDYRMANGLEEGAMVEFNGIPTVTHLHGGHTDADSDGHPESWYTPGSESTGSNYFGEVYEYDNSQEAATLWYHDHVIGITRLNVYAGLAGFYLLRDDHEESLNLPKGKFEVPLVIQDRVFDTNGQLVYPTETFTVSDEPDESYHSEITDGVIYNSILPEMFGDFILVNGKAWPKLDVQPRKYRLRLLNGSDSRFYDLFLPGTNPNQNVTFYQIGSDGGLLEAPLMKDRILIGPGERIDVIIDFSAPELWGQSLILKNRARSPFPFGETVDPRTSGQVMAFNVIIPLAEDDTSIIPISLRNDSPTVSGNSSETRQLVLFEEEDEYGRLLPSLGTAEKGALGFLDDITENPEYGATETWEIFNTTPDAHPIHLHLVHFQVVNTQKFNIKKSYFGKEDSDDDNDFPNINSNGESNYSVQLLGQPKPPAAENAGRKDTFIVYPGEVARVKAFFDKEGEYVWHCHILSHEDHDMMRPFYVGDLPEETQALVATVESALHDSGIILEASEGLKVAPNPLQQSTKISFILKKNLEVKMEISDYMGRVVARPFAGAVTANERYEVTFDRQGLPTGMYICKLYTSDGRSFEQIIIAQ